MDVSKLPRLSTTNLPPPDPTPAPAPVLPPETHPSLPSEPRRILEAYLSIGVGVILLLLCPNTLLYVCSKLFHTHFGPFADPLNPPPATIDYQLFVDGHKVFYRDTINFWNDLVICVFALALILDGIQMIFCRRLPVLLLALCVTVAATLANLVYMVTTYHSYGLGLMSALAVLFGGYIAAWQAGAAATMLRQRQGPKP